MIMETNAVCEKLADSDSEEDFETHSCKEAPYRWLGVCLGVLHPVQLKESFTK